MFIECVILFHLNCAKLVLGTLETLAKQKKQKIDEFHIDLST